MQVNDPDANKSWYELGEEAGLEIVDDEEEEEKMQKEEEDKEVVHIFKESKQRHEQMLRGTHVERVKRNKIHVLIAILYLLVYSRNLISSQGS